MYREILTNPKRHNPDNFIYLVHGMMGEDENYSFQIVKETINKIKDPAQFYRASLICNLKPENTKEKIVQLGIFGLVGFIINPMVEELIQIAWNCDLGGPEDQESLRYYVEIHKGKIRQPSTLLTETREHNELIVKGDKKTSIRGVFYKDVSKEAEKIGESLERKARKILRHKIPIVKIPLPRTSYEDDIEKILQAFDEFHRRK